MGDPFRFLPTSTRMWAACVLSLVPFGLAESIAIVRPAPVRVLLAIAGAGFLSAAVRRTEGTRRVARVATGALAGALALGLASRLSVVTLLVVAAGLLAGPPVWRATNPTRGGLAPGRPPA
jgi:hypothetical protein